MTFRRVCVYCGSSTQVRPVFLEVARAFGERLARAGIELVYGGGNVGSMGAVAGGALAAGGRVIGVIPEKLMALELGRHDLGELHVVPDMHARKKQMADLSDAFVALPGGYGTFEELFEAVTWTQLSYHHKPVGVLNVDGYYDGLEGFLRRAVDEGFVRPAHRELLLFDTDPARLLDRLGSVQLPRLEQWIDDV
ncbi:MAG: TIGR00730 family Rossman fold protein [Myxococcota bacterium]